MSLYNMLFGVNDLAPILLKILGLNADRVPRFRDCYIEEDTIAVHTRTGGGNRDYYDSEESCRDNYPEYFDGSDDEPKGPWNSDLVQHLGYIHDKDDDFDSTYATFYFKIPEEYKSDLKAIQEQRQDHKPSEKWEALFKALKAKP